MEKYTEFKFSWTYTLAGHLRNKIIDNLPEDYVSDYFDVEDKKFQAKLLKADKQTILHDYIELEFRNEIEYITDKIGTEDTEYDWEELLKDYKITHKSKIEIEDDENADYNYVTTLSLLIQEQVAPKVAEEVFTVLFGDRQFLLKLNELIAEKIKELEVSEHPDLLERDGVVKRATYFPVWVQRAVFLRDKGCCAVCLTDLTGLLKTDFNDAIDHIVPLNLGGSNDITNFQLICQKCNLEKLGHTIKTSEFYPKYF